MLLLHLQVALILHLLTYLLILWCRVLLEKLTGLQLVKKFPAFHRIRRFITALTSVRHLSLSWASPIQSIYPHPTSWRSVLILSTHLRLGLPSSLFPHQDLGPAQGKSSSLHMLLALGPFSSASPMNRFLHLNVLLIATKLRKIT